MFVRGLDRGGLFVGVFRLDVHGERDQQDISADLEGSYGLFSASAAMKFNEVRSKFRCDALVSMYHEGGPVDLQITDPTVPSQLLDNANRWLRSFQDDPARNAVPYSVTLAPLTIAEGPLPPNTADIELLSLVDGTRKVVVRGGTFGRYLSRKNEGRLSAATPLSSMVLSHRLHAVPRTRPIGRPHRWAG